MKLNVTYRKEDCTIIVRCQQGKTLREVGCRDTSSALNIISLMQDAYALGRHDCIDEIEQANEFLNQYNISGIRTPKDDK